MKRYKNYDCALNVEKARGANNMEVLIRRFDQIKTVVLLLCFRLCKIFLVNKPWVLLERGTDARDNAYFFYRYLKEKHPEQKVYYVIDRKSPDFYKVEEDAVHFGSLKNYWAIAVSDKIISTHCYTGLPGLSMKLFRFLGLNRNYYFLQHGITGNYLAPMHFKEAGIRMLFCAAKPEYDYIRSKYGYPAANVRYTGFPRYDSLHSIRTKHQILLMPTWRMYINDENNFLHSEYYRQWNQIIQSKHLIEYLEKNNLSAIFYPHYEMQKFLHLFHSGSDRIILADFANYDVQTLLKESKLLVSDYSSVCFDFAYMRKPVIYFQFDQDEFFSRHYNRGYFSYQKMGFGPITESVESTVETIIQCADGGFCPTDEYSKRMQMFFPLYDQKNCERIYDEIRPM